MIDAFEETARRSAQDVINQLYKFDNNKQAYVAKYNIMMLSRVEVGALIDKAIRKATR